MKLFFQKTTTGRALRAVADDHQAAQSIGIPLNRIWVIVWCVAGVVALVAGMIWGSKLGVQFSLATVALRALPVVILGGLTSVPGAIIGGLIIGVGEKLDALEPFRPEGFANRILGFGDVMGLMQKFEKSMSEEDAARAENDAKRMLSGQFDFNDAFMVALNGGAALVDGSYVLHLEAIDAHGLSAAAEVAAKVVITPAVEAVLMMTAPLLSCGISYFRHSYRPRRLTAISWSKSALES